MTDQTSVEPSDPLARAVRDYLLVARWFGGKGRDLEIGAVSLLPIADRVATCLAQVRYADGAMPAEELYQLPIASYDEPQERLSHALIGTWEGRHHYDAVHDREAMAAWLGAFSSPGQHGALEFRRLPGHDLDLEAQSALFSGEQSNSSVAFGEDSLMKVFRRVTPGVNPDIALHQALSEAGSDHVARLYGWAQVHRPADPAAPLQLAILQQFLRTATGGWELALASVRNLFGEADLYPEEVGGDFAAESQRLGLAVAQVHEILREQLPTGILDPAATAALMQERLAHAERGVPELAAVSAPARSAFARLAAISEKVESQRVHGDLHLGQTLRTSLGWKLVDFEGEPAKPLADRVLPDSPWRDVAGMLRSFDYAAGSVLQDLDFEPEAHSQLAHRAAEWVARNRAAFLEGYAGVVGPISELDRTLIAAYELDKAVYEVEYEARNRPAWIGIPLDALSRAGD